MTTTLRVNFRSCKTYLGFFFTSQNEFNELKRRNIRNFVFKWRFDSIWMFSIIRLEYPKVSTYIYIYADASLPRTVTRMTWNLFGFGDPKLKPFRVRIPKPQFNRQFASESSDGWKTIRSFLVDKLSGAMPVKLPVSISSWCGESELVKAPNSSFQLRWIPSQLVRSQAPAWHSVFNMELKSIFVSIFLSFFSFLFFLLFKKREHTNSNDSIFS